MALNKHPMILLVKNLEHKVNPIDLEMLFYSFGEVIETNLVYDTETWEPKGFAFIEMKNSVEAFEAINKLNGVKLNGKAIVVKKARVFEHH